MALLRRALLVFLIFCTGVAVAWWALPRFISSEEAEAIREPPEAEPITALAEVGRLREVLLLDAELRPRVEIPVDRWEPAGASRGVVTFLPELGAEIASGNPVVGLSERPLIFVSGVPNFHRDLHRGLTGRDVEALQSVLLNLGYLDDSQEVDGVFGARTEEAVRVWYEGIGFVPAPPPQEVSTISVLEAQNGVDQARQALKSAHSGGDRTAVSTAQRSLAIAEAQLAALQRSPTLSVPANEILGLPFEFVIVDRSSYEVGDLVSPEGAVVDLRTAETMVVASATLAQTARLAVGQRVVVMVEDGGVESTISEVITTDQGTSAEAFVRVDADLGAVPLGTPIMVEVEIEATTSEVVSVPMSAVRTDADGASYVTVVDEAGHIDVEVELGETIGRRAEIASGLKGGERVVVG